jgi:hypothetical protein
VIKNAIALSRIIDLTASNQLSNRNFDEYKVLFLDSTFLAQMIPKQLVLSQREIGEGISNISDGKTKSDRA